MTMVNVTVRGAGAFGLACAWEMIRRGATVRVIDPHGVGAGASGGIVGALSPHTPENWNTKKAFQFAALIAAEAFWAEIESVSDVSSGYGRVGRLQAIANPRGLDLAKMRAKSAAQLWQGKAIWQLIPADYAADWAPHSPVGWLIHDTLSARLHPAQACAALAAAIQARGGEIVTEGADTGIVLHATGVAGLRALSDDLGQDIGGAVKGQAALLNHDQRGAPQIFADGVHIIPHADGTVAVGSTSERSFTSPDETDAQLEDVITKARSICQMLGDAPVIARWAGLRPRARSRAPILGSWPDRPGHFVANGGFKIGFGMAPEVARVMADLVLDGNDNGIPTEFGIAANLKS